MRKKKDKKANKWLRVRIFTTVSVFLFFFGAVLARAFYIQVLEAGGLNDRASRQHVKTLKVPSERGSIFDRNLEALAITREVDSVYAQPAGVKDPAGTAALISSMIGSKRGGTEDKLRSRRQFVWLKRQIELSPEQMERISKLNGIGTLKEKRRFYPNKRLGANLIGFTGIDSNGLEGIELYHDRYLQGETIKVRGERDARGRSLLFEDVAKRTASRGMDVVLTIDKTIQHIAERALKQGVEQAQARGGMALVMDPMTGEILAAATLPTFDPNEISRFSPSMWRNRIATDTFEPGSTLKVFLLAAVLEEDVARPNDIFYCENGLYRVADRKFHDTKKHGWLSLDQIIRVSSNIGAAKVGEKLGSKRLYRYLTRFGFGKKTNPGIPGESAGILRHYKNWSGVTVDTVSFGQGVSVTAIQLVRAVSAIANGGFLMKPYVVKSIRDANGSTIVEHNPVIVQRVISEKTTKEVTRIMVGVTQPNGTGEKAAPEDLTVAGKTGTAQKPDLVDGGYRKDAYVASFLGFAPALTPRLAVFVAIDEPGGKSVAGGEVAAPVFKRIVSQSLSYLGDFPGGSAKGSAMASTTTPGTNLIKLKNVAKDVTGNMDYDIVPDFTGKTVRMVLRMARELDMEINVIGSGVAVSQEPLAGTAQNAQSGMDGNETVAVHFEPI